MVQLEQITKENIEAVLALDVNEDQKGFVSSTAESLAQAYAYSATAFPFAVSDDGRIVGFIMMGFYEEKNYYTLWKLLIDRKYQHRGYGRKALELGIAFLKEWYGVPAVFTGLVHEIGGIVFHQLGCALAALEAGLELLGGGVGVDEPL